ncbi:MAG: hypothetical protein ACI9SC_000598 [Gammaproteobacteria bacterium]|jgi:hypothetical protein
MKLLNNKTFVVIVFTLLLFACESGNNQQSESPKSTEQVTEDVSSQAAMDPDMSERLGKLIKEFTSGFYEIHPDTAVNNGLHDYDGRIPDYSAEGIRKTIAWYKEMKAKVKELDDTTLSDKDWLHKQQMEVVVDTALFNLEELKVMENNAWYGYYALDPDVYLSRAYAPLEVRMAAFIKHVNAMMVAVPSVKNNLKPMPSTYAHVLKDFASGLGEFITTTPKEVFADVENPALQGLMAVSTTMTANLFSELADWIDTQPRDENFALGNERYAHMLWSLERIDTPIEELKLLAEQDLERNLKAMDKACAEFSPGTSITDCIAKSVANKFSDGPLEGARRQLIMLKQVLLNKGIVSIPTDDVALVAESPPHQRSNSAYMTMPGPYEKGMPAIYYIAPPDPDWSREEQLSYIPGKMDLLGTSTHEVWPGHFLEGLHSNLSGNPVTELSYSYAFTEGWAHYAEELMADEGLDYDPEMKIGQLLNALLRNVRFVSSLGLHTGSMSVEESEKLFLQKAFNDAGNARQQAARGTFDPGYLFYTVGKLMIKKLRVDWMDKHPEKSLKQFHDTFLSFGSAPVPLIRKMMLGRGDEGKLF